MINQPDERPAQAQQHTYSLWVRLIAYWAITLLFFPLGVYLFYKDDELRGRPLLVGSVGAVAIVLGLLALGLVVSLVRLLTGAGY